MKATPTDELIQEAVDALDKYPFPIWRDDELKRLSNWRDIQQKIRIDMHAERYKAEYDEKMKEIEKKRRKEKTKKTEVGKRKTEEKRQNRKDHSIKLQRFKAVVDKKKPFATI